MTDSTKQLAAAVLLAVKLREESYDKVGADKAKEASGNKWPVEYNRFYGIAIHEAADKACQEEGFDLRMTPVVTMLLTNDWNNAIAWATFVTEDKPVS